MKWAESGNRSAALGVVGHLEGVAGGGARLDERLLDASQEIVEAARPLIERGELALERPLAAAAGRAPR